MRAAKGQLVGQVGNLRPIGNRHTGDDARAARSRLTIGRRFPTCRDRSAAHKSVMKTNPLMVQITPSVSAGTGLRRNRPLADAWGYLAAPGDRMSNGVFDRAPQALTVSTSSRKMPSDVGRSDVAAQRQ